MRWFANDFHSWLRHSWKSLANHLTRDQKSLFTVTHALFFISLCWYGNTSWLTSAAFISNVKENKHVKFEALNNISVIIALKTIFPIPLCKTYYFFLIWFQNIANLEWIVVKSETIAPECDALWLEMASGMTKMWKPVISWICAYLMSYKFQYQYGD